VEMSNWLATGIALAALIISMISYRYVRLQAEASASAARSAVLSTIFSDVLTECTRLIRAKLLFARPVEPEIADRAGQVRELFVAYNRAAMMIGGDSELRRMFLKFQRDEIDALFKQCEIDLEGILRGPPPRPNYAAAIRNLYSWGKERNLISKVSL